ncbi:MAG: hypothetical protein ABI867_32120 [Kofleriaceae bacterium]
MTKMISILFVTAGLLGGCATHSATPATRLKAATMFVEGESCGAISAELKVDHATTHELIRRGMADLYKRMGHMQHGSPSDVARK